MVSFIFKSATLAGAMLVSTLEAHQMMTQPVATWPDGFYSKNSPSGIIDPAKALPVPTGMSYNTDGDSNVKSFWTALNASSFDSLRDFVWKTQTLKKGASKECGYSLVDGKPCKLPGMVQWDGLSHDGPLAIYCDNTLVFETLNAHADFPESPANIPYDKAKCKGASVLSSYWVALHTTPWQIYTNCAPLIGGSPSKKTKPDESNPKSSGTPDPSPSETADTPTMTPHVKPAPTTPTDKKEAQTGGLSDTEEENTEEDTEEDTEEKPSPKKEAGVHNEAEQTETDVDNESGQAEAVTPSVSTVVKCSVRRHRH